MRNETQRNYPVTMSAIQAGSIESYKPWLRPARFQDCQRHHHPLRHDPAGHLLAEVGASGRTTREYVWLDAQPIVVLTPTAPGTARRAG